jgi:hypothetical protein
MPTSTARVKYSGWLPVLEEASITTIPAAKDAATMATNNAMRKMYREGHMVISGPSLLSPRNISRVPSDRLGARRN